MTNSIWHQVGQIDPTCLGAARHLTLNVVQWLARLTHSYLPHDGRGAHLLLEFDRDRCAVATTTFWHAFSVEMRLADLSMQFRDDGALVSHAIDVNERSPAQVEAWLLVEMLHRAIDRSRFSKDLPYVMTDLLTGDAFEYCVKAHVAELREQANWYSNAADVLSAMKARHGVAGEILCQPQTMQIGVPSAPQTSEKSFGCGLWLGFSPGNAHIAEPYFFVSDTGLDQHVDAPSRSMLTASDVLRTGRCADVIFEFFNDAMAQSARSFGA